MRHLGLGVPGNAFAAIAHFFQQGPQGGEALEGIGVVSLQHRNLGRRLARYQRHLAALPVFHLKGLGQLARGVVHQGRQHHFLLHTEVAHTHLAERFGKAFVDVPVAARLPGRVYRCGQRVDEGVHVTGVEVVFLIPSGGGQHDVGVQAGGTHAEIKGHQQVQLALWGLVMPLHLQRLGVVNPQVFALHAVGGAQQVFHEVLVTLAAGAQQVGPPNKHIAWPVPWVVRVFTAHLERAVFERLHHIVFRVHARRLRVTHHLHRVGFQLWRAGQPAHAFGTHVVVDQAASILGFVSQRRQDFSHAQFLVAPLVGVGVEETGGVHLARRPGPVQRKGQRRPAGLGAQLLLPHIVRPTAAALANAAAHHQHVDDAAVVHVAVVPVVHGSTDDDHRLALGLVGVVGKLSCHRDHLVAFDAGDFFLPGRGVGGVVVIALSSGLTRQTTRHTVVGHRQVKHGGDKGITLVPGLAEFDAPHGHLAHQDVIDRRHLLVGLEMRCGNATKVRETDRSHLVIRLRAFHQAQLEFDLPVVAGLFVLQVPLANIGPALSTPAKADGAIGQHDFVVLVQGHCFPFRVIGLPQLAIEVTGTQVVARHQHRSAIRQGAGLQLHQVGHVGVAAHIVVKVAAALVKVKLFQNHVPHGHGQGSVGALLGVHPQIGQLADLGVVGGDRHRLGALVAHFGEKVRVWRARLGHVGAPGNDEGRVVPVGGLGHIGLLAPDLRTGRRQIAVPVVKTHAHATDQGQVAAPCGIADHGHGRNG